MIREFKQGTLKKKPVHSFCTGFFFLLDVDVVASNIHTKQEQATAGGEKV